MLTTAQCLPGRIMCVDHHLDEAAAALPYGVLTDRFAADRDLLPH